MRRICSITINRFFALYSDPMKSNTYAPFAKPMYIMTKPAGALCNLACNYCYYTEKSKLYRQNPRHIMSDELLEKFIKEYIECQTTPQVMFTWHGGETLMRPLDFYKKVVKLQQQYGRGRQIDNSIQTNGTLLTDEWCRFFHDQNWLVGLSIDGPQEFHDEYRRSRSAFVQTSNERHRTAQQTSGRMECYGCRQRF